jgi:uncharacterized protein with HEPN domain
LLINNKHKDDAGSKIKRAYDSVASTLGYTKDATAEAIHNAAIDAQDGVQRATEAIGEAIDHGEIKMAHILHAAADTLEDKK